jgi:c-di-GMP-binding flagellar brake protein YcgR
MGRLWSRWREVLGAAGKERRPTARVRPPRSEPIVVHITGSNSIDILAARDISQSGLGVYVPHRFEGCDLDSEVGLVITLPSTKAFVARGVIKHRTDAGESSAFFGVEFTRITDAHRELIDCYISDRLGRQA